VTMPMLTALLEAIMEAAMVVTGGIRTLGVPITAAAPDVRLPTRLVALTGVSTVSQKCTIPTQIQRKPQSWRPRWHIILGMACDSTTQWCYTVS